MLEYLHLKNVGPSPDMAIEFAPRLNLITGDNGLGKSFLLDAAWMSVARQWPRDINPNLTAGYPARPTDPKSAATIESRMSYKSGPSTYLHSIEYDSTNEMWDAGPLPRLNPGLVIYANAEGGFYVWDPSRNFIKVTGPGVTGNIPGFAFTPREVWYGLTMKQGAGDTVVCKGLLDDWSVWIRENGESAANMARVIEGLAAPGDSITVGQLRRLSVSDVRDIPSIKVSYAESVPILYASSGIRRIVSLAYILLWAWSEHIRASEQVGFQRARQVVMLFDEIECHLHPRWQRSILKSVLQVAAFVKSEEDVQLIATTHSPLVLASAEPWFDSTKDAWFDLDLDAQGGDVKLQKRDFVSHGEASNWLTSDAFDLKSARSREAEEAIEEARALLRSKEPSLSRAKKIDRKLREAHLPDIDPFWVRWSSYLESLGGRT